MSATFNANSVRGTSRMTAKKSKFIVETLATVRRQYEVEAWDVKDAIEVSTNQSPTAEEDENEETVSVRPSIA